MRRFHYPRPDPPLTDEDLVEGFARPKEVCGQLFRGVLSRAHLYKLLRQGAVASVRAGRTRLIPIRRLKRDLAAGRLEDAGGGPQ